jgi:hypothetical protein
VTERPSVHLSNAPVCFWRPFNFMFRGRPCRIFRDWVNPAQPDDGYVVIQFQNGAVAVAHRRELTLAPAKRQMVKP